MQFPRSNGAVALSVRPDPVMTTVGVGVQSVNTSKDLKTVFCKAFSSFPYAGLFERSLQLRVAHCPFSAIDDCRGEQSELGRDSSCRETSGFCWQQNRIGTIRRNHIRRWNRICLIGTRNWFNSRAGSALAEQVRSAKRRTTFMMRACIQCSPEGFC